MRGIIKSVARFFDNLWFREEVPYSFGIFRILFGVWLFFHFWQNYPSWIRLFGQTGMITVPQAFKHCEFARFSIYTYAGDSTMWMYYWLAVIACVFFTIGYWSRFSVIILYILLQACKSRNPWVMEGQEHIAIVVLFLLCFAPISESFSLSTFLKSRKDPKLWPGGKPRPVWTLWLFRAFLSAVYGSGGYHKTTSEFWRNGTALYNLFLWEIHVRVAAIPFFHDALLCRFLTYSALALELSYPVLVWFAKIRPYLALALVAFHTGIMVTMRPAVEMFNLLMILMTLFLIDNSLIEKIVNRAKERRFGRWLVRQ